MKINYFLFSCTLLFAPVIKGLFVEGFVDCGVIWQETLANTGLLRLVFLPPKPRAEGSSPSAPAKENAEKP